MRQIGCSNHIHSNDFISLLNYDGKKTSMLQRMATQATHMPTVNFPPCLGAKARFLSFSRTQSRAVTGLLIGHNTLRRHLYLMGLSDSPLCRRCGAEDETSAHILCECEALASLRHVYLGSFFLEPEGGKCISLAAIWNFSNVTGLP
jgi:hypothetical protein